MNNTVKTELVTDDQIDELLDPVRLFLDTLDQVAEGGIYPKEKLEDDTRRFCEACPDYKDGILKYIFQGFVLGMERADIMYGNLFEDIKKSSESTATTTETTK